MNKDGEEKFDTTYDEEFNKINSGHEEYQLKIYPWVGKKYPSAKKKILVVGESNYKYWDESVNKELTNEIRNIINYWVYEQDRGIAFFNTISKLLGVKNDATNRRSFYDTISFYNIVQTVMESPVDRPNDDCFIKGWKVFIDVIDILQPDYCIFIGVTASNYFNYVMTEMNKEFEEVKWGNELIGGTYPRRFSYTYSKNGAPYKLNIVAVRHVSSFFSIDKWNDYLKKDEYSKLFLEYVKELAISGQIETDNNFTLFEEPSSEEIKNFPTWLGHKPIIACQSKENSDLKFMSIGHSYWNNNDVSIKMWRHTGQRWSRQAEEIPLQRFIDAMGFVVSTITRISSEKFEDRNSDYREQMVDKENKNEITFLYNYLKKHNILKQLKEIMKKF